MRYHKSKGEEKNLSEVIMPSREEKKLLKGQKALVTGASSGIGKSIAIAMGHAGADVVVNYVSGKNPVQEIINEIEQAGSRAFAYKADVSKEEQVQAMFQKMIDEFGTIDILVNNAGIQRDAPFE